MAQKIQTLFIGDLDGSEADGAVPGLYGTEYEVDLSAAHADALRKSPARYVEAALRTAGAQRPSRGRQRSPASGVDNTEVRAWAKSQGIEVNPDLSPGLVAGARWPPGRVLDPDFSAGGVTTSRLAGRVVRGSTAPGVSFLDRWDGFVLVRGLAGARRYAARQW